MNRALAPFLVLAFHAFAADPAAVLPGTEPLTWTGDLSTRMHEAALHDVDKRIDGSIAKRAHFWHYDVSSVEAYEKSVEPNRERFKHIIGVVDQRVPVRMEKFGEIETPKSDEEWTKQREVFSGTPFEGKEPVFDNDDHSLVAETKHFTVHQVRWPVLEGITGEGLLLTPKDPPTLQPLGYVVVVPDADQTPEQMAGLAPSPNNCWQQARYLAEIGFMVVVPTLIDRGTEGSGNASVVMTNQPHREWIHRQAYMMGRHIIGLEVQKVLSIIDWFDKRKTAEPGDSKHIAVAGYGEGGLIAFYAAAVDKRIQAALVSGYFKSRQQAWEEPLYRNVWGLLREFGDAEIATLIAPRRLLVDYCEEPKVNGPPAPAKDQKKCAAPGRLNTPPYGDVEAEFKRMYTLTAESGLDLAGTYRFARLFNDRQDAVLPFFADLVESVRAKPNTRPIDSDDIVMGRIQEAQIQAEPKPLFLVKDLRHSFDPQVRQLRQVKEMEAFLQKLVRESDHARNESFLYKLLPQFKAEPWTYQADFDTLPLGPFIEGVKPYKQQFWNEVIGRIEEPLSPPHPRTRKIYDEPKWTGYEVVLDVGGGGDFVWGVLCLPKDLKPEEKRPVVVCQHGRHGLPKLVIEGDTPAYHNFAARLAEQGFITFAPHNLYNKEDYYRTLARKGNTVKLSMFSYILRNHEQLLNWLEALPMVDAKRIGFYGLSYGGESAVRLPPLLERYCLSICSGDFNDWTRKVTSTDDRHSFMFTDEWEMPYFNMGGTFSYAELTYMMFPRPFMVERGSHDGVAPDEWVAYEFAKTKGLYSKFGLGDRAQIEFFNGGHTIHGQGTFEFLHKHLNWPVR